MTALQLVLPGQPPKPRAELSQWFTPRKLARHVVEWANIGTFDRVLEPSAGGGAIMDELVRASLDVTAVELDEEWAERLKGRGATVIHGDFLAQAPEPFDVVVGNPPYEDGQDLEHVLHMLRFAPRVVVLLQLGFLDSVDRFERLWSRHTLSRLAVLIRRPRFSGTNGTGSRPFAVFEILRGLHPHVRTSVEWW